jgi:hypothetical protein
MVANAASVGVVVGVLASPVGAASPVVTSSSTLVPSVQQNGAPVGFVTAGRNALYTASWTDQSTATITNVLVVITLPAGSTVLSTDPAVCSTSAPGGSSPVMVSCPREGMHTGDTVAQQVFFQVPGTAGPTAGVTAFLQGKEAGNDQNKSHTDSFPAPDRALTVVSGTADAAGACAQPGESLATRSGLSAANPLTTAASVTASAGQICTPVTLVEQQRSDPTQGCGTGATCTVDISVTDAPAVPAPIQLTFTFLASNKNLTWYKNGVAVIDCAGASSLPAGVAACVTSRSKLGSNAVSLGVLWAGGPDPSWTG